MILEIKFNRCFFFSLYPDYFKDVYLISLAWSITPVPFYIQVQRIGLESVNYIYVEDFFLADTACSECTNKKIKSHSSP